MEFTGTWEVVVMLALAFLLGGIAAGVTQFGKAQAREEAKSKITNLTKSLDRLVARNKERRSRLKERQVILDRYNEKLIEPTPGTDVPALQALINDENARIKSLEASITATEKVINEAGDKIGEHDLIRASNKVSLMVGGVLAGGITSLVFGFLNYLTEPGDLTVRLNASFIVQSLTLGVGWPLVWERFTQSDNLGRVDETVKRFTATVEKAEQNQV